MRIVTWNVNSIRPRVPRFLPWLDERRPDVVCLQELKLTDAAFDDLLGDELRARGYEWAAHGISQWNGVAVVSRIGLTDVVRGLPDQPGFPDAATQEARAVTATCGGVRVTSVYVPNGREIEHPHYAYKLRWLEALRTLVATTDGDQVICGDINIAPTDRDVYSVKAFEGATHVTPAERAALAAVQDAGVRDVLRERWPDETFYSYWDYRAGAFQRNQGMRIDLVLASDGLADRVAAAWVDRAARKGTKPSDHAPVVADFDEAPDGDLGPMEPMPSARR